MRAQGTGLFSPARALPTARGFTLIELLTVIAIIGILAAILIPSVGSTRNSAKRARTKVQFSEWANAMELFRQEYGFYPAIDGGTGKVDAARFSAALTGRALDGTALGEGDVLTGNTRRLAFCVIAEGDLNEARTALVDAFGNTEIAVLYDRDGDGRITNADGRMVSVTGVGRTAALLPATTDLDLSAGVRAGVLFYSPGNGEQPGDVVLSWK